jgi:hypothetical protein
MNSRGLELLEDKNDHLVVGFVLGDGSIWSVDFAARPFGITSRTPDDHLLHVEEVHGSLGSYFAVSISEDRSSHRDRVIRLPEWQVLWHMIDLFVSKLNEKLQEFQ